MSDGLPVPTYGCYYPGGKTVTCSLWEMQAYIYPFWDAGHGWGVDYNAAGIARLVVLFGLLILLSVSLGKVFCGWVCPFGLYMDLLTRLRKALKIKHRDYSEGFNERFHQLGYLILAQHYSQRCVRFASHSRYPACSRNRTGRIYLPIFLGPFCQVCPMKPFSVLLQTSVGVLRPHWIFQNTTGLFGELGYYMTSLNLFVLCLVPVAAFFYRHS